MSSSDDPLLHHHHLLYHVPQHSRREKLRFLPDNPSLQDPNYGMAHFSGGSSLDQIQQPQASFSLTLSPATPVPLGPFIGYAAVLNRSRFLDPARQLLEEIFVFGVAGALDPLEVMSVDYEVGPDEPQWRKARLISMIDEACRRYKMYYQQVLNVITSFEMVAGLSTAAPYVSLALKSMSKHFRCLKNTMCNELNGIGKVSGKEGFSQTEISSFGRNNPDVYRQPPHVWRPQRGLPERAVAVLRSWLFEHFLHPYPTDVDKQVLAKQTGLTRNQVSNWFINARVRLWKPMVEEIHNLETRQLQKVAVADIKKTQMTEKQASSSQQPSSSTATSSPQNRCIQKNQTSSCSRSLNNHELHYMPHHIDHEVPYNYGAYSDFSGYGDAVSIANGRSTGVSLTLALHQNSGVCFPEPLPLNVARRFGLEDCNDSYFGRGDSNGGHLLHDFVG